MLIGYLSQVHTHIPVCTYSDTIILYLCTSTFMQVHIMHVCGDNHNILIHMHFVTYMYMTAAYAYTQVIYVSKFTALKEQHIHTGVGRHSSIGGHRGLTGLICMAKI